MLVSFVENYIREYWNVYLLYEIFAERYVIFLLFDGQFFFSVVVYDIQIRVEKTLPHTV